MAELISKRGHSVCRGCNSGSLVSILNLGNQPLPAEYGKILDEVLDTFPLHLRICQDCGLGQLGEYVLPERIFHNTYPYLSSASATWLRHAKQYAADMQDTLSLDTKSLVIELASNDGYLLSEFMKLNVPVLGVEPAANVAAIAQRASVPTIVEFFGVEKAKSILNSYGHPRLIAANNVFAHIPDMQDFMEGMAILADERAVITIENPSFALLLRNSLFDTIYHEHYSYVTAHSVQAVANKYGLSLVRVDRLPTHGGSNRYWLSRTMTAEASVEATLNEEKELGLFDPDEWLAFAARSQAAIDGLRQWFLDRKNSGDIVAGYGAAHKGNTFLNAVGEASKTLKYVVDASPEKQGKFLPGSQVPVLAPEQLSDGSPTDVLILPWNIAPELAERIKVLAPNTRIWVAQPSMRQL
jgi:hypothetical protein